MGGRIDILMDGFRFFTLGALVLALASVLLLMRAGWHVLPELASGVFVFGVLIGTVGGVLSGAWCYFIALSNCAPGDALLGGPLGFGLGVLWFAYWWWCEARPD